MVRPLYARDIASLAGRRHIGGCVDTLFRWCGIALRCVRFDPIRRDGLLLALRSVYPDRTNIINPGLGYRVTRSCGLGLELDAFTPFAEHLGRDLALGVFTLTAGVTVAATRIL